MESETAEMTNEGDAGPPGDVEVEDDEQPIATWKLVAAVVGAFAVVAIVAVIILAASGGDDNSKSSGGSGEEKVVDAFNREDADTLGKTETGQTWEAAKGKWGIRDKQAVVLEPNLDGAQRSFAVVDLGAPNGSVQASAAVIEQGWGLVFRYQGPHNYWYIAASPDFATYNVVKIVDDVQTSAAIPGIVKTTDGTVVRVEFSGADIAVKIDGKVAFSVRDQDNLSATKVGLLAVGERGAKGAWSDFVATADGSGGSVTPANGSPVPGPLGGNQGQGNQPTPSTAAPGGLGSDQDGTTGSTSGGG